MLSNIYCYKKFYILFIKRLTIRAKLMKNKSINRGAWAQGRGGPKQVRTAVGGVGRGIRGCIHSWELRVVPSGVVPTLARSRLRWILKPTTVRACHRLTGSTVRGATELADREDPGRRLGPGLAAELLSRAGVIAIRSPPEVCASQPRWRCRSGWSPPHPSPL